MIDIFTYLLDSILLSFLPTKKTRTRAILVVRLDNIGDFVLWAPAAKGLRTVYPADEWQLILAANQAWSSLAEELGVFNEVWPIDTCQLHRSPIYRFRTLKKIRQAGFQISIHPTYSRQITNGDALIRASRAEQRIGSQGDCSNIAQWLKPLADQIYTQLVPATSKPISELERNAEFIAGIGGHNTQALPSLPTFSSLLPASLKGLPYFVLFPGASWTGRQWPASRFAELAARISQLTGWAAVLCGGAGDVATAQQVQSSTASPIINLAGKTELKELLSILAASRLVLTNDTSVAHLAPAVGTPTVCLLGGGHYGRFLPYSLADDELQMGVVNKSMECYGCNWRCIYTVEANDAVPCIANICVETVWQAVLQFLPVEIVNLNIENCNTGNAA